MKPIIRPSVGLLGRIFAILLLTIIIEFTASTLLYERASQSSVRADEARRLAEHLVVASKLLEGGTWHDRPAMAERLTTNHYIIHWAPTLALPEAKSPPLDKMRLQMIAWEPTLARGDMRVRLLSPETRRIVAGDLRLADGTWLRFRTAEAHYDWSLVLGRVVLALVPALGLIMLGGVLLTQTLRPMRMLARAAERVGRGGSARLPESGPREVRRVVRAFNRMQTRIHRLIDDRTQALAAVGHDFRTPLARLQLRADALGDPDQRQAFLEDIGELEAMVASLMAYLDGENDPEGPVRTDVAVLIMTLVDDVVDRGLDIQYVGPDHLEVAIRPFGLKRALANLVENALHYGGSAIVSVVELTESTILRVEDDGPGIPEDALKSVLQPFVRLDLARGRNTQGLGLGLAIVARAVELEGATLRLSNRPKGGLCAEIVLPRFDTAVRQAMVRYMPAAVQQGSPPM